MKKWFVVCSLILALMLQSISVRAQEDVPTIAPGSLFSQGAVLMDAVSGRVLYGKNPDLQLAMASTTKIMTCIVALELGKMTEEVTVSGYASGQPKVKLYLSRGEQVLVKDLLYSLMLESHNDSAVALAEHIGAGLLGMANDKESVMSRTDAQSKEAVQAFVSCMNEKARELQCYHTWFITPNGLDGTQTFTNDEGESIERIHSTTAEELAKIMSYCILYSPKKEEFLKITGTYQYRFENVEKTRSFSCANHNAFLNMMDGALSGKTGYTGQAGYCYVGALQRDGRYFVVTLLNSGAYGGSNKTRKWADLRKLMEYGLQHYNYREVYSGNTVIDPITVQEAKPRSGGYFEPVQISAKVTGEERVSMLLADWEDVQVIIEQEEILQAPVRAGQLVGKIEILLDDVVKKHFDIVCTEAVEKKSFFDTVEYLARKFLNKKTE